MNATQQIKAEVTHGHEIIYTKSSQQIEQDVGLGQLITTDKVLSRGFSVAAPLSFYHGLRCKRGGGEIEVASSSSK